MTGTLVTCVSPEPGTQGWGPGAQQLPRWKAYLDCVELEVDGLGAHADIVGDDVQDEGVYGLGRVQGGRL